MAFFVWFDCGSVDGWNKTGPFDRLEVTPGEILDGDGGQVALYGNPPGEWAMTGPNGLMAHRVVISSADTAPE